MAKLVFIAQMSPTTILHWSSRGNASCIRDYSIHPTRKDRQYTTEHIDRLLDQPGNRQWPAPAISTQEVNFWRNHISELNQPLGLATISPIPNAPEYTPEPSALPTGSVNLVARFKAEVKPLILHDRPRELKVLLDSWRQRLSCIKDCDKINHWDDDPAHPWQTPTEGIGWTALMLEFSRDGGEMHFIDVGSPHLDFALIGMEVSLGISSKYNLFRLGKKDYVKPDGIGVRRADSSICVLEVKGPKDVGDVYEATLQALCGALAIQAKRENLLEVVRGPRKLRPAAPNVVLPENEPSLGLYVLVSKKIAEVDPAMGRYMNTILEACPCIREICHFLVTPEAHPTFGTLPPPTVYSR